MSLAFSRSLVKAKPSLLVIQQGRFAHIASDDKLPAWAKDLVAQVKSEGSTELVKADASKPVKKALWRQLPWHAYWEKVVPPEVDNYANLDNPSLVQKCYLRFKGIPLKGEPHAPKSIFENIGKKFYPPVPIQSVPKDFKEYPERDLVNFPYPERPLFAPKMRLLLIPDSWFQAFYKITGNSGPYLFFGGLFAFLCNKEIFVYNYDGWQTKNIIVVYLLAQAAFSYRIDQWCYKELMKKLKGYKDCIDEELKEAVDFRKNSAAITESLKAMSEQFPVILKENLALQLEATYRHNVQTVSNELNRRLNYLSEVEEAKERFERDILLKSIIDGVQKQITTNEGNIKDRYLDHCISQLKTVVARA